MRHSKCGSNSFAAITKASNLEAFVYLCGNPYGYPRLLGRQLWYQFEKGVKAGDNRIQSWVLFNHPP